MAISNWKKTLANNADAYKSYISKRDRLPLIEKLLKGTKRAAIIAISRYAVASAASYGIRSYHLNDDKAADAYLSEEMWAELMIGLIA